jgi:hypothetical protein
MKTYKAVLGNRGYTRTVTFEAANAKAAKEHADAELLKLVLDKGGHPRFSEPYEVKFIFEKSGSQWWTAWTPW